MPDRRRGDDFRGRLVAWSSCCSPDIVSRPDEHRYREIHGMPRLSCIFTIVLRTQDGYREADALRGGELAREPVRVRRELVPVPGPIGVLTPGEASGNGVAL